MAKMGVLILCSLLVIIFTGWIDPSSGWIDPSSALKPPQNVIKDLLNLNLSLYWNPPDDASNATTYTVEYQEKKTWWSIPRCTNITKTECTSITGFLIAEYGIDVSNTLTKSYFCITRREQSSLVENSPSASVTVEVFPHFDATISAPDIDILELASDSIEVALLAPETPFYDNETQQFFRMDDKKLGGFSKVKFNFTLWSISRDDQDSNKVYEVSSEDSSKVVSLSELEAYTLYTLAVSARIGTDKYSKDNSTLIFLTKEAAPSRSPTLVTPFDEEVDCNKLNSRDVQIKWKAPAKKYWNGRSIHYEVRLHRVKDGDEIVTSIAVMNASSSSATVHDLSRVENYDIVVYANTSGGGTPSKPSFLLGAVNEKAGFKPNNFHRRKSSWAVTIIEWKPPSGYEECIFEYHVIVESDGQTVRTTDVKNATFLDISYLEPGSYVAEVFVITKGRNYSLPASLPLNVAQSKINQMIIPVTVGFIAFIIIFLVLVTIGIKSLRSNLTFNVSLDPFLRKAFSQTFSPSRHRNEEKEMFDTPRDTPKFQIQECVTCVETGVSTNGDSTEYIVSVVQGNTPAEPRVSHDDNLTVGSNQPLRPDWLKPLRTPSDTDDTDDDQDAENEALMQQPSRPAGGETTPESTSSRSADIVVPPSSGGDNKPSKPTDIQQSHHESFEKNLLLIKISKPSFESTPSSPNGVGLGYTVLANMFTWKQ